MVTWTHRRNPWNQGLTWNSTEHWHWTPSLSQVMPASSHPHWKTRPESYSTPPQRTPTTREDESENNNPTAQATKQPNPNQGTNNNNDHPASNETTTVRFDRRTRNWRKTDYAELSWQSQRDKNRRKNNNDQHKKTGNQPAEGWKQRPKVTDKRPQKWKAKSNRTKQQTKSKNEWAGETSHGTKRTTKENTRRHQNSETHQQATNRRKQGQTNNTGQGAEQHHPGYKQQPRQRVNHLQPEERTWRGTTTATTAPRTTGRRAETETERSRGLNWHTFRKTRQTTWKWWRHTDSRANNETKMPTSRRLQ